jgi:hypothetical protein
MSGHTRKLRVLLAGVVGVAVGMAGCRKTAQPEADDTSVNQAVQTKLAGDAGLAGVAVQSYVQAGVVTLTGNVATDAERTAASTDAAEVAGVRTVINDLTVTGASAAAAVAAPAPAPQPVQEKHAKGMVAPVPVPSNPPPPPPPSAAPIERQAPPSVAEVAPPPAAAPAPAPPPPPPAPAFKEVTVPSGTGFSIRMTQTLDSATTQAGTTFSGALASDLVIDGMVVLPQGTRVSGKVDDVKDAAHFKGSSLLAISLTGLDRRGEHVAIATDTYSKEGTGRGKNTAEKIGGGAAVGAILGGIFGGGRGAAIGAGAGSAVGAGAQGVTRGQQVQIESESVVRFHLAQDIKLKVPAGGEKVHHDGDGDADRPVLNRE